VAASWTVVVMAQDPQVEKTPTESVTLTGCVERAPKASAATAGQRPTTMRNDRFVLTKAVQAPSPATTTAGKKTTAAPVANRMKAAASEYRLEGSDSMLAPYVNRKVQIVGNPEASHAGSSGGSAAAPTLLVDSVQFLAQSCS
jgi:hypothetical protein